MPNISILSGVLIGEILELNYMKSYIYKTEKRTKSDFSKSNLPRILKLSVINSQTNC